MTDTIRISNEFINLYKETSKKHSDFSAIKLNIEDSLFKKVRLIMDDLFKNPKNHNIFFENPLISLEIVTLFREYTLSNRIVTMIDQGVGTD